MDARERLRQFLEQRRELGEREFVLDGMDVDEVLRVIGALRSEGDAARAGERAASREMLDAVRRPPAPPPPSASDARNSHDARDAAGAERPRPDVPGAASGDWRAALRAAGGAPDQLGRRPGSGTPAAGDDPDPTEAEAEMARRKTASRSTKRAKEDEGEEATPASAKSRRPPEDAPAAELPAWLATIDAPAGLSVGTGTTELFEGDIARLRTLDEIAAAVEKCTRCPLYRTATHGVPGEGNPDADLFCVGEAPGATEDETGRPFVGQSGQLLTKILAAIKLSRDDVFIANVIKHRPPANRNPAPNEVEACSPYLLRQLELVKPRVIVAFGTFAAQTLLATRTPLGKLREHVHLYHGIPLVVTYHPAALLRNQAWKRPTWEDVKLARRILDLAPRAGA